MLKLWHGPSKFKTVTEEISSPHTEMGVARYLLTPGGVVSETVTPYEVPGSYRHFSSHYAPDFYRLLSEGWVFQFPYSQSRDGWTYQPCSIRDDWYQGSPTTHTWGTYDNLVGYFNRLIFPSVPDFDVSRHQRAQDEVLTRAYAKANSNSADLLIDLSQYKQTVQLFVSTLRRLVALAQTIGAFYRYVSRGPGYRRRVRIPNVDGLVDPKNLAGLWCEMRFGWRPLLSTLNGVIEALNTLHGETKRVTYRSSETFTSKGAALTVLHEPTFEWQSTINLSTEKSYESTFRGGILLEKATTLAEDLGLDLRYVPIALWDLVPFSFIVDRFVNVGNFIRSIHPIPVTAFGGSWVVERFEYTHLYKCEYLPHTFAAGSGPSYHRWARSGGQNWAKYSSTGTVRQVFDRPPLLPTLRHDWLEFKDLYNLIDVLFLAIQRVKTG